MLLPLDLRKCKLIIKKEVQEKLLSKRIKNSQNIFDGSNHMHDYP
jgi:hypothetical protein